MLAPAGTPKSIVEKLAAEVAKATRHPDTIQRYGTLGIDPIGSTPEVYGAMIHSSIEKYAQAVKLSGVKID